MTNLTSSEWPQSLVFQPVDPEKNSPKIPFSEIQTDHYKPAFFAALDLARKNIESIKKNLNTPNFENTIKALESATEDIDYVSTIFFNQLQAHTNATLHALSQELSPLLASLSNDILLDEVLFKKVQRVYEDSKSEQRSREDLKLIEKTYFDFVRNGALLSEDKKNELRQIDEKLSKMSPAFNERVLKATNQFELIVERLEDLAGLPESAIQAAAQLGQAKYGKSYVFTLQAPSYIPFLTYADHRNLREKMWRAYNARGLEGEFSTQKIILETIELRHKRAQLLGYPHHADFVLEKRMAENSKNVQTFINQLLEPVVKNAKLEMQELIEFAKSLGLEDSLKPWDVAYYSEKLKNKKLQLNSEDVRPYFELNNVMSGLFQHAEKLFQIRVKKVTGLYSVYHSEVETYEVIDQKSNEFLGLLYTDLYPRESKSSGAWMTNYIEQGEFKNHSLRPVVAIVCNLTRPTEKNPSLLNLEEVLTLFHEFGHALHSLLSKVKHRTLAGTNVYWDFVELPSQIMENWIYEKEALDLFARHYQTHQPMPLELAEKIKKSSVFMAASAALRQLTFAVLDMAWHTTNPCEIQSVVEFENKVIAPLRLLPAIEGTCVSCSFSHIFAGGYSAGYYSYKWAEVLDADAFEAFLEKGLYNLETGLAFREHILSRGGTEHPMELYKKFRGREPNPQALLRREGLIDL